MAALYGGIEAGGTKFVAAIAEHGDPPVIVARGRFDTEPEPAATIEAVVGFLLAEAAHRPLAGVGIASFGPVDLDPASATYGHVTTTPKRGWRGFDVLGAVKEGLGEAAADARWGFDTDVNGAALGEARWGVGGDPLLYVTVGTGIGGGVVIDGTPLHGRAHPEMGHVSVPRHPDDAYEGACSFHRSCLEGLASGPAVAARWDVDDAGVLPPDHPAWVLEAHYLGLGLGDLALVLSPRSIVLAGGVLEVPGLRERTAAAMADALAGYVPAPAPQAPVLGADAGVLGAVALAMP